MRTATVSSSSYLALADCVMGDVDRAQGDQGVLYRMLTEPQAKTANIIGVVKFPAGLFYTVPAPVLGLRFRQGEDESVAIESRSGFPGSALEPRVWPMVERCAGRTLTLVPPLD